MVDAISDRNQKKALTLYYDLLTLKEPPMRILFLIAKQFNQLMQVKVLSSKLSDNRLIAEKTGINSYFIGKYMKTARNFSESVLRRAVEDCVNAEEDVKTGRMNDKMSVELLIVKYSSK